MALVLVVDPGELGELLATLFTQYGFTATHARTGEEALERALADPPKLVVVEHGLPDAPGIDLAELLKTELHTRVILTHPPGIFSEADPALKARVAALDAQFVRPFRSLSLVEAAARLLEMPIGARRGEPVPHSNAPLVSTEGAPLADDDADNVLFDITDDGLVFDGEMLESGEGAPVYTAPPSTVGSGPAAPLAAHLKEARDQERTFAPGALTDLWTRVKGRRTAKVVPAPEGEGQLTPRVLADLLDAFHQSQTSGELWLEHAAARRVLLFRRGEIAGARSNVEGEDFVSLAVRRRVLSPDIGAHIREEMRAAQRSAVDVIMARGLLSETVLQSLVAEHARKIALQAFTWHSGSFRVTLTGRASKEPVAVRVAVGDVIVRGIVLTESDEGLRAAAPDEARFAPAPEGGYALHELTLLKDEARIVVAMDGTKTIKDLLVLMAPLPERTVRGLAAGLLCLNLVRFGGWGHAEPRRIDFF